MGGNWYDCENFYGYEIQVKPKTNLGYFICKMGRLNNWIKTLNTSSNPIQFEIVSIMNSIYSNLDEIYDDDDDDFEGYSTIVIGFTPSNNLKGMKTLANELRKFIWENEIVTQDNVIGNSWKNDILANLPSSRKPKFYCGINTFQDIVDRHWCDYPELYDKNSEEKKEH
jgi:hypothetical protein